jgi:hypothetical protein
MRPISVLAALVLLASARVCDGRLLPIYWSEATTAKVVVDGVGDPVPGVIVVAAWTFTGLEGAAGPTFEITETVTDEQGRFHIPGWGPRLVWPPYQTFEYRDPWLLLFKAGYKPRLLENKEPGMFPPGMVDIVRANKHREARGWGDPNYVRRSYWSGRAISFTRKEAAWEDLDEAYNSLTHFAFHNPPCGWKKTPRLLAAMLDMAGRVAVPTSDGRPVDGRALMLEMLTGPSKPEACGSVQEFLRAQS